MILPADEYGSFPEVKKRVRKQIARIIKGESLVATMTEAGFLNTDDTPGELLLGGSKGGREPSFHTGLVWLELANALGNDDAADTIEARVFAESITTAWGVLPLMVTNGDGWTIAADRHQPFLDAVLRFWPELEAVGPRFCYGFKSEGIWEASAVLRSVLVRRGVPVEAVQKPLAKGELRAMVERAVRKH